MNCDEALKVMDAYLDGELDPITNQTIEQHLRECPDCEKAYQAQSTLVRTIGSAASYYKAPMELRERIRGSLREESGERRVTNRFQPNDSVASKRRSERPSAPVAVSWNWLALAAAIVLAAILVSNLGLRFRRPNADQILATELISSHVRSLMANHLTDVASSDQHTVKPWLDTKLDFAPAVPDLSSGGFPLIGGRLDYLNNRPVAALIYQRRKHFINLFIWPAEATANRPTTTISQQGYQLLHWVDRDFNYWAVSDVNDKDLETFKQAFEEQIAHH